MSSSNAAYDPQWDSDVEEMHKNYGVDTIVNLDPSLVTELDITTISDEFKQLVLDTSGQDALELQQKPVLKMDETDDSHPLPSYYISSSHNTYLLSRQLVGRASAASYIHVLSRNARCVEIDAWPSSKGLVVTHGHTFTHSIPLQSVLLAISVSLNPSDWPLFVSLECHVPLSRQGELVSMFKEAWGEKLVQCPLEDTYDRRVSPRDFKGKILLMIEYYPPPGADSSSQSTSDSEHDSDQDSDSARAMWPKLPPKESKEEEAKISDELAELGFYCRSMKPKKGWFAQAIEEPANVLINISESSISKLLPSQKAQKDSNDAVLTESSSTPISDSTIINTLQQVIAHSHQHLRRVYPRGTRIESSNPNPLKTSWRNGSQVAALNWQSWDLGTQLNEAMFVGSGGYVLKPKYHRARDEMEIGEISLEDEGEMERGLRVRVAGVCAVPMSKQALLYLVAELYHTSDAITQECNWTSSTQKSTHPSSASSAENSKIDLLFPADSQEGFQWKCAPDSLAFIRFVLYHSEFARSDKLAIFCARLEHVRAAITSDDIDEACPTGWRMLRMMDGKTGKYTGCKMMARFEFS